MIVVSDTSPINYLLLIEAEHLLPLLFQSVYIPQAVADELRSGAAPPAVARWMASPPAWLLIRTPARSDAQFQLDPGETQAIALAEELKADHILMDERAGRDFARRRGLHVVGTLGVLDQAAERNLMSLAEAFERLQKTSFRIDRAILQQLLNADATRKSVRQEP